GGPQRFRDPGYQARPVNPRRHPSHPTTVLRVAPWAQGQYDGSCPFPARSRRPRMRQRRGFWYGLLLPALLPLLALLHTAAAERGPEPKEERPRLVVLVVFDQLRGDYLSRWEKLYGAGGFRRLQKDGAWYRTCHHPYAGPLTAAGPASLATGCPPCDHGIIANEWYDRTAAAAVNAVRTERYRPVPEPPGAPRDILGGAPIRRRRPAVGD